MEIGGTLTCARIVREEGKASGSKDGTPPVLAVMMAMLVAPPALLQVFHRQILHEIPSWEAGTLVESKAELSLHNAARTRTLMLASSHNAFYPRQTATLCTQEPQKRDLKRDTFAERL